MSIAVMRREYHRRLADRLLRIKTNSEGIRYPNFADIGMNSSISIAWGIVDAIGFEIEDNGRIRGQTVGNRFERITKEFLEEAFGLMEHLRPGLWRYSIESPISQFDQYHHLAELEEALKATDVEAEVAKHLGRISDYIVAPDIVISRHPVTDSEINRYAPLVKAGESVANLTPLRSENTPPPQETLHASISCKWTIRSDRAQNARAEALNLARHRKGKQPHVVAVTAEPMPTRISCLALGTGDLDCVYHFALYELIEAVAASGYEDQADMLSILLNGRRLRDISDLPFDLAI